MLLPWSHDFCLDTLLLLHIHFSPSPFPPLLFPTSNLQSAATTCSPSTSGINAIHMRGRRGAMGPFTSDVCTEGGRWAGVQNCLILGTENGYKWGPKCKLMSFMDGLLWCPSHRPLLLRPEQPKQASNLPSLSGSQAVRRARFHLCEPTNSAAAAAGAPDKETSPAPHRQATAHSMVYMGWAKAR